MKNHRKKLIGQRIREARLRRFRKSVTMTDAAKILIIPFRTYQNWELGITSPKHDDIIRLANLFKVDPGWLEFGPAPRLRESTKQLIREAFPKEER